MFCFASFPLICNEGRDFSLLLGCFGVKTKGLLAVKQALMPREKSLLLLYPTPKDKEMSYMTHPASDVEIHAADPTLYV